MVDYQVRLRRELFPEFDDIEQVMEIQARFRGLAVGCGFAEGFSRLEAWQRGLTRRILPSDIGEQWTGK